MDHGDYQCSWNAPLTNDNAFLKLILHKLRVCTPLHHNTRVRTKEPRLSYLTVFALCVDC